MTVAQMIIGVQLGVQKTDSNAYDNLLDEEILYYLNKANREYIRRQTLYLRENMERASRQDFIADNESANNLRTLITEQVYPVLAQADPVVEAIDIEQSLTYTNARTIDISNLKYYAFIYATAFGTTARECKLISHSDLHLYTKNDYNNPIFRRLPVLIVGNELQIFLDGETSDIDDFDLVYIKTPLEFVKDTPVEDVSVTTPELPEHTHDDIVDLAVAIIMEDIKSARPYEQNQTTIKGT